MTQDNNFLRSRVYSDPYHKTIEITNVRTIWANRTRRPRQGRYKSM